MQLKFKSEKQFTGKSAIVTGATLSIGKAIALELAKCGANVGFNYAQSADKELREWKNVL